MDAIGVFVSFLGKCARRTIIIIRLLKHYVGKCEVLSAGMIELVKELWRGQTQTSSSARHEDMDGGDVAVRELLRTVGGGETIPTINEGGGSNVPGDKKHEKGDEKADAGEKGGENEGRDEEEKQEEEEEEEETAQEERYVPEPKRKGSRKGHNGVGRSSKKKGNKCRAGYTLRGVSGE